MKKKYIRKICLKREKLTQFVINNKKYIYHMPSHNGLKEIIQIFLNVKKILVDFFIKAILINNILIKYLPEQDILLLSQLIFRDRKLYF